MLWRTPWLTRKIRDDSNDTNISNLALGYTVKDIQLSDNYITLSTGYGGSLVYSWDGQNPASASFAFFVGGLYAYKTIIDEGKALKTLNKLIKVSNE